MKFSRVLLSAAALGLIAAPAMAAPTGGKHQKAEKTEKTKTEKKAKSHKKAK